MDFSKPGFPHFDSPQTPVTRNPGLTNVVIDGSIMMTNTLSSKLHQHNSCMHYGYIQYYGHSTMGLVMKLENSELSKLVKKIM